LRHLVCIVAVAQVGVVWADTKRSATTQPIGGAAALEKVRAVIATDRAHINTGDPLWVDFLLYNTSDRPVTLEVPEVKAAPVKNPAMGLPLAHVFSGERFRALSVTDGRGKALGRQVMQRPPGGVPPITLGPKAVVGLRMEVGQYYSAVRGSGLYVLQWIGYGGAVKSNTLRVEVKPLREVVIATNMGKLRLRMLYDKAPNHVTNFLELVNKGFYNRTKFFRVYTRTAVMGGDPNNDGTGIRRDGKTIKAEFNDTPFEEGTVGMSLAGEDPDSASCQFFICMRRVKEWDRKYTAFAKVVGLESLETLRKIGDVAVDGHDRPVRDVYVELMSIETVREGTSREQ